MVLLLSSHELSLSGADIQELGTKMSTAGKAPKDKTVRNVMAEQLQTKAADMAKSEPSSKSPTGKAKANPKKGTKKAMFS